MNTIILYLLALLPMQAFAAKVALVKLIRGEVVVVNSGQTQKLIIDDWVENGSVIKTSEKSFVKLIFLDKSQMNVGPASEMKIENFSDKDSGVIDLVKGKIRSQVTKDYLQIQDKDKSKLFIKTNNAVLGVRGTDFLIASNGKNTSTILFEGEVVFNRLTDSAASSPEKLEEIVNRGVRMYPGEFSVMETNRELPTVPSLLNIQQKINLEHNVNFDKDRSPEMTEKEAPRKSLVPDGLTGQQVSNNVDVLKKEVSEFNAASAPKVIPSSKDPDGYIKGNLIKPANGSFVHVETGVVISPGHKAVLDSNTNTYIAGPDSGSSGIDGTYIPPKNVQITDDGKVLVSTSNQGKTVVTEIRPPAPVLNQASSPVSGTQTIATPPPSINSGVIVPTGGLTGTNDPSRVLSGSGGTSGTTSNGPVGPTGTTTIIVKP
jgi:hypothetical protein